MDKEEECVLECDLQCNSDLAIPADMHNHFVDIKLPGDVHRMHNRYVIAKILQVNHQQCFPLELNQHHYLLQINKCSGGLGQTIIEIRPTFKIINLIGVDIQVNLNEWVTVLKCG